MRRWTLDSELLWGAYSSGIFPMAEGPSIFWYQPERRGLLPIAGIRISRSLQRTLDRGRFRVTFDLAFREVMEGCMDRDETWLTPEFVEAYTDCHKQGWGHSCEVWEADELVGGVYGLAVGAVFCGESMFSRRTDASKVALCHLVDECRELGFQLFDCQILNPHTASLGGYEIIDDEYLERLEELIQIPTKWSRTPA